MIFLVGTRGSGKTAELLKFSADSGIPIAVHDSNRATSLHIDAPDPVVIGNGVYGGRPSCSLAMERGKDGLAPVLVDGLESFFGAMGLRADVVTVNADALNIDFELAAKANPSLLNYLRYRREIRKGGTK